MNQPKLGFVETAIWCAFTLFFAVIVCTVAIGLAVLSVLGLIAHSTVQSVKSVFGVPSKALQPNHPGNSGDRPKVIEGTVIRQESTD